MAVGIAAAFYKVFLKLIFEFVSTGRDAFTKKLDLKKTSNSRKFMYYTFIPYIFMLVYVIPVGGGRNIFQLLHSYSYDGNLISEGVSFLINAVLMMIAFIKLSKNEKGGQLSAPAVLITSVLVFFSLPVSGLSMCALVISVLALFGVNRKIAFRYFISLSVPVLIVRGIIEIACCVTYVNIITGIIGVAVAGAMAYFVSKLLLFVVKNNYLKDLRRAFVCPFTAVLFYSGYQRAGGLALCSQCLCRTVRNVCFLGLSYTDNGDHRSLFT